MQMGTQSGQCKPDSTKSTTTVSQNSGLCECVSVYKNISEIVAKIEKVQSKQTQLRNIAYSNRPDRIAQLAEHWAGIPKVVGSNPTVARHIFQACPLWIYTQSNITQASYSPEYITPTQQIS